MHINPLLRRLSSWALVLPLAAQAQGKAHEHGAARLDVIIEAGKLSLQLEAPLDSLFGFERAPRTGLERQRVEAAITRLTAADTLLRPDPTGGCTLASVELTSAALGLGRNAAPSGGSSHADLDATIEFQCKDATRLGFIEHDLFGAFATLQRIDVQVVAPKGQLKRTLKRPASRIALVR